MTEFVYSSPFKEFIQGMILQKHSLGYKYDSSPRVLYKFDQFCLAYGCTEPILSKELVQSWSQKHPNEAHATMKMSDYIDLLKREPTKSRIFLWNILKEIPQLQKDFSYPDFGLRLMKGLPMLFFGGRDSYTFMHYDIDLANIFHFHFEGEKQCILFDQKQNKYLYKIPHFP